MTKLQGHSIPTLSDSRRSLVRIERCPTPLSIQVAFERVLNPQTRGKTGVDARRTFVNAQWAFGGEGTGAPVINSDLTTDYFSRFFVSYARRRFIITTQHGKSLTHSTDLRVIMLISLSPS